MLSDGPRLTWGQNGIRGVRIAYVTGLVGNGPEVLAAAYFAPGMPRRFETWPGNDSLLLNELDGELLPGSPTKVKVTLRYGFPDPTITIFDMPPSSVSAPRVEIRSTVQYLKTRIDASGNLLMVDNYTRPIVDDAGEPIGTELAPPQPGEVEAPFVMSTFIFRRREPPVDNRGRGPIAKSELFSGHVNSGIIFETHLARTWLCTDITAVSDDGARSFNYTYVFQRNRLGWDPLMGWTDPVTGRLGEFVGRNPGPAGGLDPTNGLVVRKVPPEADFGLLDLHL